MTLRGAVELFDFSRPTPVIGRRGAVNDSSTTVIIGGNVMRHFARAAAVSILVSPRGTLVGTGGRFMAFSRT
ncbi:hypothetical protein ACJH6H_03705 [Mycobacterium sp. SMC-21]|uniref:hypothetical protein n=1 Tax=unclassified Mycobacterium TaxID=2642494 RepID=UPI0038777B2B